MSRATPIPLDLTARQLAMLARLADIGMEIAEAAGRQARGLGEDAAGGDGSDPALSFARAARAVRLTIALQARLVADQAALVRAQGAARSAEAARRRDRIHARIERCAEAERAEAEEVEHLSAAAWERLTETEDAELLDRPIEEVVARICADLGLSPDWAADTFGAASPPTPGGAKRGLSPGRDLPPPSASRPPPPLRRGGEGRRVRHARGAGPPSPRAAEGVPAPPG